MRVLIFLSFIFSQLFAFTTAPLHTTVQSVDLEKETVSIKSDPRLQKGMYGVLSHRFDTVHATALSWVEVNEISAEATTLKLIPIYALEQSALPTGTWEPKAGDEIILPYNYHRSLLIAPNRKMYNTITKYHKDKKWVHPDIFAAVLSSRGHPTPLIEDFQYACRMNNIGTVTFNFDRSLITVDCHSFAILENKTVNPDNNETILPFYTRVTHIENNWFGAGSDELEEYAPHYIDLLAESNPDDQWIQAYKKERERQQEESEED